jgi:hypothetical protein
MGVIGFNGGVVGPDNTPTTTVASGVWTLDELFLARADNIWPEVAPPVVRDAAMWMDAADLATITESGGSVSQWNNKGTLGNFIQTNGALQPTTGASTLNGLNVLDFSDDFLEAVNTNEWKVLHDGTKTVWLCVIKLGVTANPGVFYNIFMNANNAGEIGFRYAWSDVGATSKQANHEVWNASTRFVRNQVSNLWPANSFVVASVISDPSNGTVANRSEAFADAGSGNKNNTTTGSLTTANPTNAARIGADDSGTNALTGSIAEMIVISGADATESNRVIVRDYLNAKWGVY